MTGIVSEIKGNETFCLIATEDGTEYFAHKRNFANPEHMKLGQKVQFRPKPYPAATDVQAA